MAQLCTGTEESPVLDWEGVLTALVAQHFDSPVVLELYGLEGKIRSLEYLQQLRGRAVVYEGASWYFVM